MLNALQTWISSPLVILSRLSRMIWVVKSRPFLSTPYFLFSLELSPL